MKILCCLNADAVSSVALNLLLPALAPHDVHVALTTRVGAAVTSDDPAPRRELRVAEQSFALEVLFPLVERAQLPRDGRYLTFREIEQHLRMPVTALPNPNDEAGLATIRGIAPDLIVSIRYGAIFKAAAIAVPTLGILNLHAGLLPAYRGVIASFRALSAGEREIGCTLHYITDGTIDTGTGRRHRTRSGRSRPLAARSRPFAVPLGHRDGLRRDRAIVARRGARDPRADGWHLLHVSSRGRVGGVSAPGLARGGSERPARARAALHAARGGAAVVGAIRLAPVATE